MKNNEEEFSKKVYLFYLHDDCLVQEKYPGIGDNPTYGLDSDNYPFTLYGWTTKKEYRDQFKNQRNMDIFTEAKEEFTNRRQFEAFSDLYNSHILEHRALTTKAVTNGIIKVDIVFTLSTSIEVDHVVFHEQRIIMNIFKDSYEDKEQFPIIPGKCFDDKYKRLLDYFNFYSMVFPIDDLPFRPYEFKIDSLGLYVHEFMNTYRKDVSLCESTNFIKSPNK